MSKVRVRPKHQITLPARIVREAGIGTDDLLDVTYTDGTITLMTSSGSRKARKALMDYAGIARGVWGETAREIDRDLRKERDSWER